MGREEASVGVGSLTELAMWIKLCDACVFPEGAETNAPVLPTHTAHPSQDALPYKDLASDTIGFTRDSPCALRLSHPEGSVSAPTLHDDGSLCP